MITTSAKHALRVLQVLADHPGQRLTGGAIARLATVPAPYLAKILARLRKAGFVEGQKGWGGGFQLSATGAKKPVLAALELFSGSTPQAECVFGLRKCDARHPCSLHAYWEPVRSEFRERLDNVRIADIGNTAKDGMPS